MLRMNMFCTDDLLCNFTFRIINTEGENAEFFEEDKMVEEYCIISSHGCSNFLSAQSLLSTSRQY